MEHHQLTGTPSTHRKVGGPTAGAAADLAEHLLQRGVQLGRAPAAIGAAVRRSVRLRTGSLIVEVGTRTLAVSCVVGGYDRVWQKVANKFERIVCALYFVPEYLL